MTSNERKWPRSLTNLKRVMMTLLGNRRGAFGIAILVIYLVSALAAPLLTGYDPIQGYNSGAKFSKPAWFSLWDPNNFVSIHPVSDTGFASATSVQDWSTSTSSSAITVARADNGNTDPGSMQVTYARDASQSPSGVATVDISRSFSFPYKTPPLQVIAKMAAYFDFTPRSPDNATVYDSKGDDSKPYEIGYTLGEPVISGLTPPNATATTDDPRIRFVDTNNDNVWEPGESIIYDLNANHVYDSGEPVKTGPVPAQDTPTKDDPKIRFVESAMSGDDPVEIKLLFDHKGVGSFEVWNASFSIHPYRQFGQRLTKPFVWLAEETYIPGAPTIHTPYPLQEASLWVAQAQVADTEDTGLKARYGDLNAQTTRVPAIIFNGTGDYDFRVQLNFRDTWPGQGAHFTVYLDDFKVSILGPAFGVLGTDQLGRDIFTQLLYGARLSLFVGIVAALLTVVLGLIVGLFAGFAGGITDEVLMRFSDMLLVLPTIPLLIVLIFVLGANVLNIVLVIGVLGWPGWAKVVRSSVVSLRERPFIEAAKAVGAGRSHIIGRHILPNVMSLTYVTLATTVPGAIIAEAALSFLGLGDATATSWGKMLRDTELYQGFDKLWWVIPPGLSIALVSLSFILIGYALDDILNPKLRIRR